MPHELYFVIDCHPDRGPSVVSSPPPPELSWQFARQILGTRARKAINWILRGEVNDPSWLDRLSVSFCMGEVMTAKGCGLATRDELREFLKSWGREAKSDVEIWRGIRERQMGLRQ